MHLIQGNCLTELAKLEAQSIACLITDPPYGNGAPYYGGKVTMGDEHPVLARPRLMNAQRKDQNRPRTTPPSRTTRSWIWLSILSASRAAIVSEDYGITPDRPVFWRPFLEERIRGLQRHAGSA
jgi:hypothetical protein